MKKTSRYEIPRFEDETDTSLQFKEHSLFFEKYFELRRAYITSMSEFFSNLSLQNLNNVMNLLISIIDWTSPYLENKLNIKELKNELIGILVKIGNNKPNKPRMEEIYFLLDEKFRQISKIHEQTELLPKTILIEEDEKVKFWKEEGDSSMRELKKAFYDLFTLNNQ